MGPAHYDKGINPMRSASFHSTTRRFANQRGVVLVVVLWLFIFLFVVALDFSASMREDATAAQRYGEDVDGYYLALAGITEGVYSLLREPAQSGETEAAQASEPADGVWNEGQLGTGLYRVRVVDEGGKINLNRADEETLRRVFRNLGVEEEQVNVLVDSIMDWRDSDDLHRVNGAENDYYQALPYPYSAKNGTFDAVEDLLWVRGMSSELFYGLEDDGVHGIDLRDIFTVDSQLTRVNLRTANAAVIHVLLGVSLKEAEKFVEERRKLSEKTFADLLRLFAPSASGLLQQYFAFVPPSVVAIEAGGYHDESNTERRIKAVVRLGGGNRSVEILRWMDDDANPLDRKRG
jgi:general secretion pathway protein K